MASSSGIKAGKAYVELFADNSKLVRGLKMAESKVKNFGAKIGRMGAKIAGVAAAGIAPALLAIQAASNMEEVMNKFNVVFGKSAGQVKKWSDALAKDVGRSKRQIAEFMSEAQDLYMPMGFDSTAATAMSKTVTQLAIDMASFNNKNDADVFRDIQSALTGSSETMKKYGSNVQALAVNNQLLSDSIDPKSATEQQKVMARLAIIIRETTAAQGDAKRSAEAYANQMKRTMGVLEDAGGAIGKALLPIVTPIVKKVGQIVEAFGEWAAKNKALTVLLFKVVAIVGALGGVLILIGLSLALMGAAIGGLVTLFTGFAAAGSAVVAVLGFILSPLGLVIAVVVALGVAAAHAFGGFGAALGWLKDKLKSFGKAAIDFLAPMIDALKGGQVELAAKILWVKLKTIWAKGKNLLLGIWQEMMMTMAQVTAVAVNAIQVQFDKLTTAVAKPINELSSLSNAARKKEWDKREAKKELKRMVDRSDGSVKSQKEILKSKMAFEREFGTVGMQDVFNREIDKDTSAKSAQFDADLQAKIEALLANKKEIDNTELDALSAELAALVAQVRTTSEGGNDDDDSSEPDEKSAKDSFNDLMKNFTGAGGVVDKIKDVTTTGSFTVAALGQMGKSNTEDRIMNASETTAKNTSKIARQKSAVFT